MKDTNCMDKLHKTETYHQFLLLIGNGSKMSMKGNFLAIKKACPEFDNAQEALKSRVHIDGAIRTYYILIKTDDVDDVTLGLLQQLNGPTIKYIPEKWIENQGLYRYIIKNFFI